MQSDTLREDKREFFRKLRSGELECTPQRLALATHITNTPNCECDVCGPNDSHLEK